jgi:hypothetical protein
MFDSMLGVKVRLACKTVASLAIGEIAVNNRQIAVRS